MRRKLYLVNEVGSTFFFDYYHGCVIEELDGLGFEFDIDYERIDTNFIETKRTIPQRTIQLTLDFYDGYKGFTRWREYITKSKELRLFYSCDGVKYCYVNISSSSKTQIEQGILKTKVKIDCLSLWLVNKSYAFDVTNPGGGKVYTYQYPYSYAISFNGRIQVENKSSRSVPLLIRMIGNLYYPRVVVRQHGEDIQTLRMLIDERDHPTIEVNADPTNQYIKRIIGVDEADLYNAQDFSTENFLFLPPGESEIFFDPGVREPARCEIEFKEQYINDDMSDFEKEMQIVQWMVQHITYDWDNFNNNTIPLQSYESYGAIVNGVAVCDGYSKAFQKIAQDCGLTVNRVSGTANGVGGWGSHAWNQIYLDDEWYNVDVTWEDPIWNGSADNPFGFGNLRNLYINIPDNILQSDHSWTGGNKCTSYKYGFLTTKVYLETGNVIVGKDDNIPTKDAYFEFVIKNYNDNDNWINNAQHFSLSIGAGTIDNGYVYSDKRNYVISNTENEKTKVLNYIKDCVSKNYPAIIFTSDRSFDLSEFFNYVKTNANISEYRTLVSDERTYTNNSYKYYIIVKTKITPRPNWSPVTQEIKLYNPTNDTTKDDLKTYLQNNINAFNSGNSSTTNLRGLSVNDGADMTFFTADWISDNISDNFIYTFYSNENNGFIWYNIAINKFSNNSFLYTGANIEDLKTYLYNRTTASFYVKKNVDLTFLTDAWLKANVINNYNYTISDVSRENCNYKDISIRRQIITTQNDFGSSIATDSELSEIELATISEIIYADNFEDENVDFIATSSDILDEEIEIATLSEIIEEDENIEEFVEALEEEFEEITTSSEIDETTISDDEVDTSETTTTNEEFSEDIGDECATISSEDEIEPTSIEEAEPEDDIEEEVEAEPGDDIDNEQEDDDTANQETISNDDISALNSELETKATSEMEEETTETENVNE